MSNNGNRKRAAPAAGRPGKARKPRKPQSEEEDSNDSVLLDQQPQENQRTPSPLGDEPTIKMPEVIVVDKKNGM